MTTFPLPYASQDLGGQVALVTGASAGLGSRFARVLAARGAKVAIAARRLDKLEALADEIRAAGGIAVPLQLDVTDADQLVEAVAQAQAQLGLVQILVNNAGTHLKKFAEDTTPEDFQSVLTTHVLAAHALTRAAIPGMVANGRGSILFTSSMAAFMGVPQVMAYAAAKSAYFGMVSTLSAELSAKGVRVNAIAPGWIFSDMTQQALDRDPARKARVLSRIQMGRMGSPEDIGWEAIQNKNVVATA
jgi:gluconate 5-dehydrogenase